MALRRRSNNGQGNGESNPVISGNLKEKHEYEGRLVYVADLGLQERSFKSEVKPPAQQVSLGFEIIGETVEYEDGTTKPKILWCIPFYIYHEMSDKGKELQYYKIFDPDAEPKTVADWEKVLGTPCTITVEHYKKEDNVYDNIKSIAPIPKKYQDSVGESTIEPCIGDADEENNACNKALFGLARYVFDKRINDSEVELHYDPRDTQEVSEPSDDIPF